MIPKEAYIQPNGDLVFKARGKPPELISGYYRDKGDPYKLILDTHPCVHRTFERRKLPCGKFNLITLCTHFKKTVNNLICNECDLGDL